MVAGGEILLARWLVLLGGGDGRKWMVRLIGGGRLVMIGGFMGEGSGLCLIYGVWMELGCATIDARLMKVLDGKEQRSMVEEMGNRMIVGFSG